MLTSSADGRATPRPRSLARAVILAAPARSGVVIGGRGGAGERVNDPPEEAADELDELDELDDVDEEELRRVAPETETGGASSAPAPPPKRDTAPRGDVELRFNLRPRIDSEAVRMISFLYGSVAPDLSFSPPSSPAAAGAAAGVAATASVASPLSPVQWRRALAALATLADAYLARYPSTESEDAVLLALAGAETRASSSGAARAGRAARATLHAGSGVAAATAASMRVRHEVAVKMRRGEKKTLLWLRSVAWSGLPRAAAGAEHEWRASADAPCASTLNPARCAEQRRFERHERALFSALAKHRARSGAFAAPATWGTAPGAPGEGRVVFVTFNVTSGGASAGDLGAALRAALQDLDSAGDLAEEVTAGLRNLASMLSGGGAQLILPAGSGAGEGGSCGAPPPQLPGAPLGLPLPEGGAAPPPPADEAQRAAAADHPRYKRAYCVQGARIRGNWRGKGRFYPGQIRAVHTTCVAAAPAPPAPAPPAPESASRGGAPGGECCAVESLDDRLLRFQNCERDDAPPAWVVARPALGRAFAACPAVGEDRVPGCPSWNTFNGTFDIVYDDGDIENGVPVQRLWREACAQPGKDLVLAGRASAPEDAPRPATVEGTFPVPGGGRGAAARAARGRPTCAVECAAKASANTSAPMLACATLRDFRMRAECVPCAQCRADALRRLAPFARLRRLRRYAAAARA